MTAVQLTTTNDAPLAAADLDEWIAEVKRANHDAGHWPNEWARNGLTALLGKPVPHGRWTTKDLLALLDRARTAA